MQASSDDDAPQHDHNCRQNGPSRRWQVLNQRRLPTQRFGGVTLMIAAFLAWFVALVPSQGGATPSFPGAAGFGTTTPGGRGGPVLVVTSLADAGPGTLRWALEDMPGPRIVVLAVEGEIALSRQIVAHGRVTLFGQTAPGRGAVVTGARLAFAGDDVIVRGMRIRPGDGPGQDLSARDAITIGGRGAVVRRAVVDGCSFSWATDENASIWGDVQDVTFSNNIVAEGLGKGGRLGHGLGLLISRGARRVSVHGNLFASNWTRNPQVGRADVVEIINNLVVNPVIGAIEINTAPTRVDAINNVLEAGPDTRSPGRRPLIALQAEGPDFQVFVSGNRSPLGLDATRGPGAKWRAQSRVAEGSGLPILAVDVVRDRVLEHAGARAPIVDEVDARILAEASAERGSIVASVAEAGGPTQFTSRSSPPDDSDGDGIPSDVERRLGSDPSISDSHLIPSGSEYAWIEIYANGLFDSPPH